MNAGDRKMFSSDELKKLKATALALDKKDAE
jgi:hypothetical protein